MDDLGMGHLAFNTKQKIPTTEKITPTIYNCNPRVLKTAYQLLGYIHKFNNLSGDGFLLWDLVWPLKV